MWNVWKVFSYIFRVVGRFPLVLEGVERFSWISMFGTFPKRFPLDFESVERFQSVFPWILRVWNVSKAFSWDVERFQSVF